MARLNNVTLNKVKCQLICKEMWLLEILTIGSGASPCLHMTHGTPVPRPTAIPAAQFL
jgi:hypothetical protein